MYLQILKTLASKFKAFNLRQLPREENAETDALFNLGYSLRIPPEIKIPKTHILIPAIEDPSNKPNDPNHHEQITNATIIEDPNLQPLPHDPNRQGPNNQDP